MHLKYPVWPYPNYPNGVQDNTHFQALGAIEVARLVATALCNRGVMPSTWFRQLTTNVPASAIIWPRTAA